MSTQSEALRRLLGQAVALTYSVEQLAASQETTVNNSAAPQGGCALFSPMELLILQAVPREGWTTSKTILAALHEKQESDVPALLRNLVERGALDSAPGKGYSRKVNLPG
jgi:hypothetical protein